MLYRHEVIMLTKLSLKKIVYLILIDFGNNAIVIGPHSFFPSCISFVTAVLLIMPPYT